jgi:sugar (glycoside-pentoside-hexuronide) transporter
MNNTTITTFTTISGLRKLGYGLSTSANNLAVHTAAFFLLYYLTDVYGISAAAAAMVLFVVRIWDAVIDPVVGYASDHTRSRWGSFRPYLLFGAVPMAVCNIFLYTSFDLGPTGKLIYIFLIFGLHGTLFSLISVPQSALIAVMSQDTHERSSISAYGVVVGMITTLLIAVLVKPVTKMFDTEQTGFFVVAAFSAAPIVAFYLITFFSVKEVVRHGEKEHYGIRFIYQMLVKNKPLLLLCVSTIFAMAVKLVVIAGAVYYFKYYVGNEGLYPLFMLVFMAFAVIGSALVPFFSRRIGKPRTYIGANIIAITGALFLHFIPPDSLPLIFIFASMVSLGSAPTFVLMYSMAADTVEYGELKTGVRTEGLTYSLVGLTVKFAAGLGGAISGFVLSATGYVPNAAQTPLALQGIISQLTLIPLVLSVCAVVFIYFYEIDDSRYQQIIEELAIRKKASAGA